MNNHGKWQVSSNFIGGGRMYIAVRLIDKDKTDHSGNREYAGGYSSDREAVQKLVDELNGIEQRMEECRKS